jgi:hypothetical protein
VSRVRYESPAYPLSNAPTLEKIRWELDEKRAWQSGTSKLLFFHLFLDSVISFANSCKYCTELPTDTSFRSDQIAGDVAKIVFILQLWWVGKFLET